MSDARPSPTSPTPEDLLSAGEAAAIAHRSVRTIRRAYSSGRLRAYRDGSGRGVRIRYADLRDWLQHEPAGGSASPVSALRAPSLAARGGNSLRENLALLRASRESSSKRGGATWPRR